MTIRLAIADDDLNYVERIRNVFDSYDDVALSTYTDTDSLQKALLSGKKFDVLLFSASVFSDELPLNKVSLAILFLDDDYDVPFGCSGYVKIDKYQRVSSIYRGILENFAKVSGRTENGYDTSGVEAVAFYSPVGGAGKTILSLALASKLAMQGKRVFYINFEETASEGFYLPQNGQKGLSELLSCIGEDINFTMKIQGMLQSHGNNLFYLSHFDSPNDIYDIELDELQEILEIIKGTGLFDCIIIDMSSSLDEKNKKIFELSDKIIVVERANRVSMEKLKSFYGQTYIINENLSKIVRVMNFDIGERNIVNVDIPLSGSIKMIGETDEVRLLTYLVQSPEINFLMGVVK